MPSLSLKSQTFKKMWFWNLAFKILDLAEMTVKASMISKNFLNPP